MTARRYALAALLGGTLAIGAGYASAFLPGGAPAAAPYVFAVGTALVMVASMALGAARPQGLPGILKLAFALVFTLIGGGFVLALAMPPENPLDPALFLGLPPRTAVVLLGIGLLPVLVLPVAYALTFDRTTLTETDLDRVRAAARAARAGGGPAPLGEPPEAAARVERA